MDSELRHLTAISVFSGGGGMDLGIARAGFRSVVAIEKEKYACATLERARAAQREVSPGHIYLSDCTVLCEDIRAVPSDSIRQITSSASSSGPDLLVGGPPCVTFSVAGRREGLQSDTGMLFSEYVRVLKDLQPKVFLFENVKGLLSAPGTDGTRGGALSEVLSGLRSAGYQLSWKVVDAADYGVPQHRHRLLIVGSLHGKAFVFPAPTHQAPGSATLFEAAGLTQPWNTVKDAFLGLPPVVPRGCEPHIANHVARAHRADTIKSFAATPPGKRNPRLKRDRLEWHRPAKVIRAQGKPKANGSGQKNPSHQSLHPVEHRQITVRESARIQTFPDWYLFDRTFVNGYRVVGDAVPPVLAEAIAAAIRRQYFPQKPTEATPHSH